MKKGFTLIELLGVIVVLSLIILIVSPNVKKIIKGGRNELYQEQLNGIEESARVWGAKHLGEMPDEGESIEVTLDELKKDGSAKKDLINPKTDEPFDDNFTKVIITNKNGNFKYEVVVE